MATLLNDELCADESIVNHQRLNHDAFYWVVPDRNVGYDPGQEWQDEIQPMHFNGCNTAGEMLWNFLGFDGSATGRCCGFGRRSEVLIAPTRRLAAASL